MDPLKEGDKIFAELAKRFDDKIITDIDKAAAFLESLLEKTQGLVIVDFLDTGNWDCIDGLEADSKNGLLFLHWRDYRKSSETEEEALARKMAFPADLYAAMIHFNEIRIVDTSKCPLLFVRGYALKDKEIKKHLGKGSQDFELFDDRKFFSKTVIRKYDGTLQLIECFNTPIFSMVILPKNSKLRPWDSKHILYQYNLLDCRQRLWKVRKDFENGGLTDCDVICEKANTVRRILENTLKIECCYRFDQINVKKDYSDLRLGDLIKILKPVWDENIKNLFKKPTIFLNELSHDSGKPVDKELAGVLPLLSITYIEFLRSEIQLKHDRILAET